MRRWTRWAATAAGAAGAGAGLAVARHRSRAAARPADIPPFSTPTAPLAADPSDAPADLADDPGAALDAARQRLRDRADALRRDIESSGGERPEGA